VTSRLSGKPPSKIGLPETMTAPTAEPDLLPLAFDDTFQFGCHSRVPCFNRCCRDLSQALMPYDVLRLKKNLNISTETFLSRYAEIQIGPATGLPVATLRFFADEDRQCPFVTDQGCRVYADRPASCRIYPLVRLLRRSRTNGNLVEQFALLREPHCQGFEQQQTQTVRQWIASQELEAYHEANDMLMELIALKNQRRPGSLPHELSEPVQTAFYDLEALKEQAAGGRLKGMDAAGLKPVAELHNDLDWLKWSMEYICYLLFGAR
jgi:Fe-S-cluster containining protein